jgi:hypothetical protein
MVKTGDGDDGTMQVSHETIYLQVPAQRCERSLRSLSCCSDGVRGRGERSHAITRDEPVLMAPFQSNERTALSNRGIKRVKRGLRRRTALPMLGPDSHANGAKNAVIFLKKARIRRAVDQTTDVETGFIYGKKQKLLLRNVVSTVDPVRK